MFNLTRLIYTSHATFTNDFSSVSTGQFALAAQANQQMPIDSRIAMILEQSRQNNYRAGLSGVLYFADGFFFQCVEGSRSKVIDLLERLQSDQRHENMKISSLRRIRRRHFNEWTMKYVPINGHVMKHVEGLGYDTFNPTQFDESEINGLIDLFTRLDDSTLERDELSRFHRLKSSGFRRMLFTV